MIEVVSPGSEQRDYEEKPEEYLAFGVLEYWIVDDARQEVRALKRSRGIWSPRIVRPPEIYKTPLLPGFRFDCGSVFAAGKRTKRRRSRE